jgi:hypothetical protein
LRRLRRILTCTLLARFSELRKSTGFCLFICFFRNKGRTGATRRALHRSGRDGDCPAAREESVSVKPTFAWKRRSAAFDYI